MKGLLRRSICLALLLLMVPIAAQAGTAEEAQEAKLIYWAAQASFAAYPIPGREVILSGLVRDGWNVVSHFLPDAATDAKFLWLRKDTLGQRPEYMLAIAGAYSQKDIDLFFRVGKVPFGGSAFEEFETFASNKDSVSDNSPKVHRGFHKFAQTALQLEMRESADGNRGKQIADILLADPEQTLYLTGHSIGGATAVLLAARLISLGVKTDQLKIVTFAAPTLGNAAFADNYGQKMISTRIVIAGDPIPGLLPRLYGGFHHFGKEIKWTAPGYAMDDKHFVRMYLDQAIRFYYDKTAVAINAGVPQIPIETEAEKSTRVCIADIRFDVPDLYKEDIPYMRHVLVDEYRRVLAGYSTRDLESGASLSFAGMRAAAASAECEKMIVDTIWSQRRDDPAVYSKGLLREPEEAYYLVTLEQMVYRVSDGALLDARTYQKDSKSFTPLGALLSASIVMGGDIGAWNGK